MPTTMLAMTVTDWVVMVATVVLACATVVLALLTFRYTRHTDRIARHAREQVETIARLHREEREERRRLAFHAIRLELQQIRDACDSEGRAVKASQPVRLPTTSWDMLCGETGLLGEELRDAIISTYGHARLCNSACEHWANVRTAEVYTKVWVNQAGETHKLASTALGFMEGAEPA